MPLLVNLRHLKEKSLALTGELSAGELDLDLRDDLVRAEKPLKYQITVDLVGNDLLAQGTLRLPLQCVCVRCLKPFEFELLLKQWTQLLPLEGEEQATVANDCVDLTPLVREDILLEFPQHPLCETGCRGLAKSAAGKTKKPGKPGASEEKPSAWAALDKLKLKN